MPAKKTLNTRYRSATSEPTLGHNADTFMTIEGFFLFTLAFFTLLSSRVLLLMIKSLRSVFFAGLILPLAFSATAAPVNNTLPPNVQQALSKAKLQNNALSW